jgi:phage recombination protein Bet
VTALAKLEQSTELVKWGMNREQLDLLKRTYAAGTTDDEFALFMNTSQRLKLDPFAKQIYAIKRRTWDREANDYVGKLTIQVGIDGFRAVADSTGDNDGQDGPYWCGEDGVWRDVWLSKEAPAAAKVVVWKRGCSKPFTGIATFRSYAQRQGKDQKPTRQWEQMADVMLAKCAEALALRKAFPSKLSGVYSPEEMGQADNDNASSTQPQRDTREVRTERILEEQGNEAAYGLDDQQVATMLDAVDSAESLQELNMMASQLAKLPGKYIQEARRRWGDRAEYVNKKRGDVPTMEVAP